MKEEIKLGDKVKDSVTGIIGIVTARTKFLNGCIQYSIERQVPKTGLLSYENVSGIGIDEMNLVIVKKNVVNSAEYPKEDKPIKKTTGGKNRIGMRMRGY